MNKRTSISDYIKSLSHEQLADEVRTLVKRNPQVKDYFTLKLHQENEGVLEPYKKSIRQEFFPTRGIGDARLSVAKKPISEYRKVAPNSRGLVDLMLCYVECGVDYTLEYGDLYESFYMSMETMFENALKLAQEISVLDEIRPRAEIIRKRTHDFGWGFGDQIDELFCLFYAY